MIAPVRRFFIRVCIEPRLLPGVRCSVLKTEYRSPSCWMTMPGRRRVALTLLIVFLRPESGRAPVQFLAFSGVPGGGPLCDAARGNHTRHAGDGTSQRKETV